MSIVDEHERERALCVSESFCVSAPAGSGKTSLLVKRFLKLLTRVQAPESVVAITFTRKAAAEMRARIITALRSASAAEPAKSAHEQALADLAATVLEHDAQNNWGLLANPSRLRLQTIDSFCAELTRQMPVLSGVGGSLAATDDSAHLYRLAVESFLARELRADTGTRRADIESILLHLDNNWESCNELLSRLLQRREQWQPVFGGGGLGEGARRSLEEILDSLVLFTIDRVRELFRAELPALSDLLAYRRESLPETPEFSTDSRELRAWKSVATLLLTGTGQWRKTVTKRDGFPAGKGLAAERKQAVLALLGQLSGQDSDTCLEALQHLARLPDAAADAEHWAVLSALTRLLPRLGAELLMVFQGQGEVDHPQIAMAALASLGDDSAPTDLALRLDHRIDHLLVDEFQDTSSLQFELIRRLSRGWAEHNHSNPSAPRTLFLVGDPMQSIYGFRQANVGLFIRARDEGMDDLPLEPIELSVNFRSQSGLVEWVNSSFEAAMPAVDDAQLGAVRLRQAGWARPGKQSADLALFCGENAAEAETAALCHRVAEGLDDPQVESIAILGRTRSQLRPALAQLREAGIDALARDLDALEQRPLIRDLVTLCTVLGDRFDRFAWLSLLRCPSVALDNHDLLQMSLQAPIAAVAQSASVPGNDRLSSLSAAGRERVERLLELLRWADHYRDRLALRVWIEECWLRFGGAALVRGAADISDVDRFLQLMEDMDSRGASINARALQDEVSRLFASPGDERCKLQVMTLHKAKGLEFDWVFIPALAKTTASHDSELLLWDEFSLPGYSSAFLMDIRSAAEGKSDDRLYDYLKAQAKQKRHYEATRLFYVGCTRAADYLWLGGTLGLDEKTNTHRPPSKASLLAAIWPKIESQVEVHRVDAPSTPALSIEPVYRRLARLPKVEQPLNEADARSTLPADNRLARAHGTAVHRCLESLVYRATLPTTVDSALARMLESELLAAGADHSALSVQLSRASETLDRCLADPWLRWILAPAHEQRFAELPLTVVHEDEARSLILDYVFVDTERDERWVVDYKTAAPLEDEDVPTFMARQLKQYGEQLKTYQQALRLHHGGVVRCALYFTAIAKHAEWDRKDN